MEILRVLFCCLKITSWVFEIFSDILLAFSQTVRFFISMLIYLLRLFTDLIKLSKFVASPKWWTWVLSSTRVGVQQGQSYLRGRCLFSLGWLPFQRWYHDKNTLWGRCFITLTSLTPHLFLLGWLKPNLILLLDQLRLA